MSESDRELARALFSFSAAIQEKVRATGWPVGWEWRMHPGTWNRIKVDTNCAEYITMSATEPFSGADDLLGSPVVVDASLPFGAVELRYADQMMLPLGQVRR